MWRRPPWSRFSRNCVNISPIDGPHGMGRPMAITAERKGDDIAGRVAGLDVSPSLVGIVTHGGERVHAHWVVAGRPIDGTPRPVGDQGRNDIDATQTRMTSSPRPPPAGLSMLANGADVEARAHQSPPRHVMPPANVAMDAGLRRGVSLPERRDPKHVLRS